MPAGTMLALLMLAQGPAQPVAAGYEELSEGRNVAAIASIELDDSLEQDDPARLINLGIAYARRGDEQRARQLFQAAAESDSRCDLQTASGQWIDSRELALKAVAMLDRGEFKSASRMTMR